MIPPIFRALVVEDDRSWQQIVSEIIVDCGLVVDVASSFDEAVLALKNDAHRLAVVDLSLSPNDHNNYDGLHVLEAAHRLDPNCKTVLLTGFATVELAVSALTQFGAYTFLRKESFQRNQFREIISSALAAPQQIPIVKKEEKGLPYLDQPEFPAVKQAASAGIALIIEDDAGWRSILTELLSDAGFEVRLSASFGDALGNLRRDKYTLAVVDLSLTGSGDDYWKDSVAAQSMTGYNLLSKIKEEGIPAIVVSGVGSPDEIERAYKEQAIFAYIEKQTFERATFRRIVEEARAMAHSTNELNLLTDREREVLLLLATGMTNKEIAEKLIITTNTVKRHIKAVFEKLNVHTRSAAAAKAIAEKG